jgi:hypothetical protein
MAFDPNVNIVFDVFAPYTIVMSTVTEQGTMYFTANVKFNADGYSTEVVEAAFQGWLDFLKTSTDFPVQVASRNAVGVQNIT